MLRSMHTLPTDPSQPFTTADFKELDHQIAELDDKIADATGTERARLAADRTALAQRKAAAQEDVSRAK